LFSVNYCTRSRVSSVDANPLCVSRDGRLLMAPVSPNYDEHNDEWHGPSIGVWDLATGARVMHLKGHSRYQVNDLCLSVDGSRLYSAGDDRTVRVWDLEQGVCEMVLDDHSDPVSAVCESPDGKRIFSAGGTQRKAGGGDSAIRLWDTQQFRLDLKLEGHTGTVCMVRSSPDGTTLMSSSKDCTVRVWDLRQGSCVHVLRCDTKVYGLALSADGTRLAAAGFREALRVWDTASWEPLHAWEETRPPVGAKHVWNVNACFSPDGRRLFAQQSVTWPSGATQSIVRGFDVESGALALELIEENTGADMVEGERNAVLTFCFTPDGKRLIGGRAIGDDCPVWELPSADVV